MEYKSYCHGATQTSKAVAGRVGPLQDTLLTLQTKDNKAAPWITDYMEYKSHCHDGSQINSSCVDPLQDTLLTLQTKDGKATPWIIDHMDYQLYCHDGTQINASRVGYTAYTPDSRQ